MTEQESTETATVTEDKFNGTATLHVTVPHDADQQKRRAKAYAKQYFQDVHGSSPSKIVTERDETRRPIDGAMCFTVMVADHSSGSLCNAQHYEVEIENE